MDAPDKDPGRAIASYECRGAQKKRLYYKNVHTKAYFLKLVWFEAPVFARHTSLTVQKNYRNHKAEGYSSQQKFYVRLMK